LLVARASAVSSYILLILIDSKGKSADMMKDSSKRKRTRQEMEEVREFEQDLKEDRQKFLQQAKRLKQERDMLQERLSSISQSQQTVQQQYN
jgi:cell division septum initiation protein DivIVA